MTSPLPRNPFVDAYLAFLGLPKPVKPEWWLDVTFLESEHDPERVDGCLLWEFLQFHGGLSFVCAYVPLSVC